MSKNYKIIKVFNHNVVFCVDATNTKECILVGRGIGFNMRENDSADIDKIEKVFFLVDENNKKRFKGLSEELEQNIVGVTEEIIAMLQSKTKTNFDEKIHVTLLDHIGFTIERYNNGLEIKNPFIAEIKALYHEEYLISSEVIDKLNNSLGVNLPEDEVGFIAMHIHAAVNNKNISKTGKNTVIINETVKYIEDECGYMITRDSIDYARLVTHLRFAIDRAEKGVQVNNLLLNSIKRKFKDSFKLSKCIANKIKKEYSIILNDDEIGYLAIHLEKLKDRI